MAIQTKLSPDLKNQILDLNIKGLKRSEIAKKMNIPKVDVINALIEFEDEENKIKREKLQAAVAKRESKFHMDNQTLVDQYCQAYLLAVDLKDDGFSQKEIAEILNQSGYLNLRQEAFADRAINNLLNNTPAVVKEFLNARKH